VIELEAARHYGRMSRDRRGESRLATEEGSRAALESFYYAFNSRDLAVLQDIWSEHPLAQLNNPLGGLLRGGDPIVELYGRVFDGPARVEVDFADIVEYIGADHAVFAGRETGCYQVAGTAPAPLAIRTTRYFRYDKDARWRQYHHHGSIDDPDALHAYQMAVG
jgi:ketosteroid isomerase-like protein